MAGEVITPINVGSPDTLADSGGAGRGGSDSAAQGPLVVVQQSRGTSPPRPAPRQPRASADASLRNGYAAISHSVSGETAAIGLGFLVAGPVGAIVSGTVLPAVVAASMWRARRREHDENTNRGGANGAGSGGSGSGRDRNGSGGGRGNSGGRTRTPNGADGAARKSPKGPNGGTGGGLNGGKDRKPKIKDPVADKLGKAGKGLLDKLKPGKDGSGSGSKPGKGPNGSTDGGSGKGAAGPKPKKPRKDHSGDYPDDRRWRGRGHKDPKPKKQKSSKGGDASSSTAPDGLGPKNPKGDGPAEDRIELVKAKRERDRRRRADSEARKAAGREGVDTAGEDPRKVTLERIRYEQHKVDLELHRERQLLALAAAAETPRSTPVNYPATTTAPAGTRTAGTAVARQVDPRSSTAYTILKAMADQLAHGLHGDDDADMADHLVELVGIGGMCRSLSVAVTEASRALSKTAPLHPSVIKHLNSAATAARTAGVIADSILIVFVREHREDIMRVLDPRVGEERWNIRNAAGTLDAAKLRAAISSAHVKRGALPAGSGGAQAGPSGRLVPASEGSTKKLINLMKGFTRGHMTVVLSEVAGSAAGVELVADSITRLYRRMAKSWPTETAVDDTVRATASKVQSVADELRKAIKAAQRAHQRELKLNAKGRAGKGARVERAWDVVRRGSGN